MADDCRQPCANGERLAVLAGRLESIETDVERRVTVDRFAPVEKIVYGLVGCVLVAFLTAILGSVIINRPPQSIIAPPPAAAPGGAR